MNWRDIVLGIIGYLVTLGITYYVVWDVPWLIIFSGAYLLGIVISWVWTHWTDYDATYSFIATIVTFLLGVYILLGKNALLVITRNWCSIPPCVPLYWLLLVLLVGNAVYVARPYFNKLVQK